MDNTGCFGHFGCTKNGILGARIKILRPLFNTNTPLKPPFSRFGNNFRPRKSDFWPFYWFWSFSHWNSHWSRKILRTAEGRVVHQKQKLFWKSETKWNNLKPCRSWRNKIFSIRITLLWKQQCDVNNLVIYKSLLYLSPAFNIICPLQWRIESILPYMFNSINTYSTSKSNVFFISKLLIKKGHIFSLIYRPFSVL